MTYSEVSRRTRINRSALREWARNRDLVDKYEGPGDCVRCHPLPGLPHPEGAYSYLLGLYLGDGYISYVGDRKKRVWAMRIACADAWPGLISECVDALKSLRPGHPVHVTNRIGCKDVSAQWKHWPCYFPQHGPGRKHTRRIELAPWQDDITHRHPRSLLRGLFHSDGCRFTNPVRRKIAGEWRHYEYPRYFFTNESQDILGICTRHLDQLGIEWKMTRRNNVSVAQRASVALLDEFIGPKY
ncbi:transcriptional regulator [Nocardiopsis sediminis]|uniref:Transcriptional regulator n=1 Tax=Nocardiopsis sediminis TaxID=1778267 RepID=A0ABV8FVA7_9ACTN